MRFLRWKFLPAEQTPMKTLVGSITAAALASMLAVPLALGGGAKPDSFIKKAIEGNLAEIKVGQLAQQKGASEGVRHFGTVLEQDHSTANSQAMTAASSMGVTPPAEPSLKEQAEYRRLAALSGSKFDEAFVKEMVKDHKKDIAEYEKQAKASNSQATSYAEQSLPTLKKHLQLAESLERHPGG
jgi:putative membrane protein